MNPPSATTPSFNILVVDDTPDNLRLLVGILTKQGYKVRPVPSGKLALQAVQGMLPDLILLDINMPEMDGYEVCRQLKAKALTRPIPIIFLSALSDVFDKVKAFEVGGVDYITKPFQIAEVIARIETHLTIRLLQTSLEQKNEHLSQTLQELQATQEQLIQAEKLAVLGQIVANVAHEMNTPLGAIRSSAENISDFLNYTLQDLPKFLQTLAPEQQDDFFALLHRAAQSPLAFSSLSSKEKRQLKRSLAQQLEAWAIAHADIVADTLVDIGVHDNLQPFLPLLQAPNHSEILEIAYQLASVQKSVWAITTSAERAARVVLALKSYVHRDPTHTKLEVPLSEGIETALALYSNQLKQGIEVVRHYTDLPPISCYPDDLSQVWANLIQNALQAMEYRGTLTIDLTQQEGWAIVRITDTGKGIPAELQAKVFEPFFTTKQSGEGSGLGLNIVKKIIDKHAGKIELASIPGATSFTISLPFHSDSAPEIVDR
jgi:two-component system NtrC family sensor kinase